jgi:hypothetical protein
MTSLQQLLAISALLSSVERAIEAKVLSPADIDLLRTAAGRVRAAFVEPREGRSEVKRQA